MTWGDFAVLRTVLKTDGYASAAAGLGLSHATVRACVERVEQRLGTPLFTHGPEGLTPTAAAVSLWERLDRAANTADLFERISTGPIDDDRGVVRVGVGSLIGDTVVPALWTALTTAHPGLSLELVADYDGGEQPVAEGTLDIATLAAQPVRPDLAGTRIGTVRFGLYARGDYIAAAGEPSSRQDLRRFELIGGVSRSGGRDIFALMGLNSADLTFAYRTDRRRGQLAAIEAGLGVGCLPLPIGDRGHGLARILPGVQAEWDVWLATRRDMAGVRRIALVRDAMLEGLQGRLRD